MQSSTKTYRIWIQMRNRCENPKNKSFKNYGGRGIQVCAEWMSFQNFIRDMGLCPEGFSIERKNNDGNYEAGNCIWIPRGEQLKNTRRNIWITHNGETLCANDACKKYGVAGNTFRTRMFAAKGTHVTPQMIFDSLVSTRKNPRFTYVVFQNQEMVLWDACEKSGVTYGSVGQRAKLKGETHQQAFDHLLKRKLQQTDLSAY